MKKTGAALDEPEITICMATYNGQQFLKEQIDSFFSQTCKNWQLLVRDDGSKDGTLDIINQYIDKYPGKIKFVEDAEMHLGASLNFGKLLEAAIISVDICVLSENFWNVLILSTSCSVIRMMCGCLKR